MTFMPLKTTVDPLFERADLPFAPAILRELTPHADQRHRVWLAADLEMAVLASKAAAGKALAQINCGGTNLVWSIVKEGITILDEPAEWGFPDRANAWRRPRCEIDDSRVLDRRLARDRCFWNRRALPELIP
jgi:hypothetical protein